MMFTGKKMVPYDTEFSVGVTVEKMLWPNDDVTNENGYAIVAVSVDDNAEIEIGGEKYDSLPLNDYGNIVAKGPLGYVRIGQNIMVRGMLKREKGDHIKVDYYEFVEPQTAEEMLIVLRSGVVKGVGHAKAEAIVNHFGDKTFEVMDTDIKQLLLVSGIGNKNIVMIAKSWERQRTVINLIKELGQYNVSTTIIMKAYKKWRGQAGDIVIGNPYRLTELSGVGFFVADDIALKMGIKPDDSRRIEAAISYVLNQESMKGHVFLPQNYLVDQVMLLFEQLLKNHPDSQVKRQMVFDAIDCLVDELILHKETVAYQDRDDVEAIYLMRLYKAESNVASRLKTIANEPVSSTILRFRGIDWERKIESINRKLGFDLAKNQAEAVKTALTNKVVVVTGGPGTGKSTLCKAVVDMLDGEQLYLCAPTGKAAIRLEEATGHDATTIHRLLGATGQGSFGYNEDCKLDSGYLIVDESSMIDTVVMHHLLDALPDSAHIMIVGDIDQLPSVGAGRVLNDIIDSGLVPVVRLETIFRQGKGSTIIENAHRINRGDSRLQQDNGDTDGQYYHMEKDTQDIQRTVIDLVTKQIPQRMGIKPDDVQVLSAMKKGSAGTVALNMAMQAILNPSAPHKHEHVLRKGVVYRVGDRIMQIRNNYDDMVFNGEIGVIEGWDEELGDKGAFIINFGSNGTNRLVNYEPYDLSGNILHAYAMTVHKSQGSEFPCVVFVMTTEQYVMLARNLFYTGLTRAKQKVVVVGQKKACGLAIANNKPVKRFTSLKWRLEK